ncbi:hypothetical protein BDR07DRAFT_1011929 [Suillus spraguei]|nr:hypothetical protein BDR07DRAFT_1011929 [Suillus spraguei]
MVKYCGYLVSDEWLYQRGVELGYPRPNTYSSGIINLASRNVRLKAGVCYRTRFREVQTRNGELSWCIAFASNDPYEGLATSAPSEKKYKRLKEALQKNGPPRCRSSGAYFTCRNHTVVSTSFQMTHAPIHPLEYRVVVAYFLAPIHVLA